MLGQEACGDHADPVMHEAGSVQLAHAGIHNRVPGHPIAPSVKLLLVVPPGYVVIFLPEGVISHMREVPEDAHEELSPDQLVEPGLTELHGR